MATAVKKKKAKPPVKLPLYTEKMIRFIEYVKENKLENCKTEGEVLFRLGFSKGSINNMPNLRNGHQKFQVIHFYNAVKIFGVSGDYFFNKDQNEMFHTKEYRTARDLIKEALAMI